MQQTELQREAQTVLQTYEKIFSNNNKQLLQLGKIELGKQIQVNQMTQAHIDNIEKFNKNIKDSMAILSMLQAQKMNFVEKPLNYTKYLLNFVITKLNEYVGQYMANYVKMSLISAISNTLELQNTVQTILYHIDKMLEILRENNSEQYGVVKLKILQFFIQKYSQVKRDSTKQLYLTCAAFVVQNIQITDEDIYEVDFEVKDVTEVQDVQKVMGGEPGFFLDVHKAQWSPNFQLCCKLYSQFEDIDLFKTLFATKIMEISVELENDLIIHSFIGLARQNLTVQFNTNGILASEIAKQLLWLSKYVPVSIQFVYTEKQQEYAYLRDVNTGKLHLVRQGKGLPYIYSENPHDIFAVGNFLDGPQTLGFPVRSIIINGVINTSTYQLIGNCDNLVAISLQGCNWIKATSLQNVMLLSLTNVTDFYPSDLQQMTKLQQFFAHKCDLLPEYPNDDVMNTIISAIPDINQIKYLSIKWCTSKDTLRITKQFPCLQKLYIWAQEGLNTVYIDMNLVKAHCIHKISVGCAKLILKGVLNKEYLEDIQAEKLDTE